MESPENATQFGESRDTQNYHEHSRADEHTSLLHRDDDDDEVTVLLEGLSILRVVRIVAPTWIGSFLYSVDVVVLASLAGPIASEFHSLSTLAWPATAYFIANAAVQPALGRLTDVFGRGPGHVVSCLLFALGNLVSGFAGNQGTVILGRVLAVAAAPGLMSIPTFLTTDLLPLRSRGVVQGAGSVFYGLGLLAGGVLGGALNDSVGWRWAFLAQVPPAVVTAALVAWSVRVPPKRSDKKLLARIDLAGILLTVAFLVLLLVGLNTGGNQVPWSHPLPLTTIPLSAGVFGVWFWRERRARNPIVPVKLLGDGTVLSVCTVMLLSCLCLQTVTFYVPVFLQVIGYTPTEVGVQTMAIGLGPALGPLVAGIVMKKTGQYRVLNLVLAVIFAGGLALLVALREESPGWLVSVAIAGISFGYSGLWISTHTAITAATTQSQQAVITSAVYLASNIGGTLGVTLSSAVYQNVLRSELWARFRRVPGGAERIRRIVDDLDELKNLPPGWREGVMQAFMGALGRVWQ